jgi:transposase
MDLIEEIRQIEAEAEDLKRDAEEKGRKLLDRERKAGEEALKALASKREDFLKKELNDARRIIAKDIAKLNEEYEKRLKNLNHLQKRNGKKAIKKVQEIILRWPLSQ